MNKTIWTGIIVAVVFAGGGFYAGTKYQASQTPTSRFAAAGGAGFTRGAGAGGGAGFAAAGGGATFGTIISMANGSITIQMPNSTSSTATTGTKLVLVDNATQVQELESVAPSTLQVGQSVTVAGTSNSDGSITATSVMVRPVGSTGGGFGGRGQNTGTQAQTQSATQ